MWNDFYLLSKDIFNYFCVCLCVYAGACVHKRRETEPLELVLQNN